MTPADAVRTRAHAKLNLSLRVLEREASGFHQIDTLFCALDLADDIEITLTRADVTPDVTSPADWPRANVTLDVTSPADRPRPALDLGPADANLAVRAAQLLMDRARLTGGVHVRLVKRIPAGAGLGGGSSDAAAVLTTLNTLLPTPFGTADLMSLSASLGSDVPFFISGTPLAIGRGRGEHITPLPALPRATVLLAAPPERVSTAAAYAALADARSSGGAVMRPPPALIEVTSWEDLRAIAHNDFEPIVLALHPHIGALRNSMEDSGAMLARLTGTGSVVFGIFDDDAAALAAAQRMHAEHRDVETVLTHTRAGVTNDAPNQSGR